MGAAPTLETARLTLRPFRESDLDAQAAIMRDPETMRYLGAAPQSREETWRRMLAAPGLWTMLGYGYWAVERRADGRFLGQIGFADYKRDVAPSIEGIPEMGWIFASDAGGHGYAAEACAAAIAWAEDALDAGEYTAIIAPDNARSIRLAERLGFGERQEVLYRGEPILIFRRPVRSRRVPATGGR